MERGFARRSEALLEFPLVAKAARTTEHGPVAQLVSAPPCHGGGRGFKSRQGRQFQSQFPLLRRLAFACSPGRKFLVKFPGHLLRATVQHFTVGCDLGHMVKGT